MVWADNTVAVIVHALRNANKDVVESWVAFDDDVVQLVDDGLYTVVFGGKGDDVASVGAHDDRDARVVCCGDVDSGINLAENGYSSEGRYILVWGTLVAAHNPRLRALSTR